MFVLLYGIVKLRIKDIRLTWTPHYYRQFALSLPKESPHIFFKFKPLNTDTPLIQTLSMSPPPPSSVGSFSIDDGRHSENVTFKKNSSFLNTVASIPIAENGKCGSISLELISWGAHSTLESEKEIRRRLFTSSIKLAIVQFGTKNYRWTQTLTTHLYRISLDIK